MIKVSTRICRGLFLILAFSVASGALQAQQASNFGAHMALTISDCTGIDPLDSCVWPGDPLHVQNRWILGNFLDTEENTSISLSEPGFGSAQAGIEFSGDLFTPTLANASSSSEFSRNGASIFSWQTVTYIGTAPIEVPFGGDFSYSMTGTADASCFLWKDIDTGGFQFTHGFNTNECGSINVILEITDLELDQVIATETLQSVNGLIASPTTVQTTIEMIPGRPYEIYAVVQTIVRGLGQSLNSTNSFEIGLVDPDTGQVTKDVPDSLPELQNTLVPASDESQPNGIQIDVLPNDTDNLIRVGRRGVVPVALITTPVFYAPDVDRYSLQFGPNAALVAGRGGGPEDVDGDGDMDYVVHFRAQEAGFSCGDNVAFLSGLTIGDDIIIGSDTIEITRCP